MDQARIAPWIDLSQLSSLLSRYEDLVARKNSEGKLTLREWDEHAELRDVLGDYLRAPSIEDRALRKRLTATQLS